MGQTLFGGVEAGGTKFRCAIGTAFGTILASATIPTRAPKDTLREVGRFFRSQRTRFPIEALGIASFGPVDLRPTSPLYGHITSTPKLAWRDFDMVTHARRSTGVREIAFDTDVNAAVLAEAKWGAGRKVDPLLYVTLGTGVGGATFVNGGILRGLMHPEMGHIRIPRHPADTFEGCCPSHGDCFEGLASGKAMAIRWGMPAQDLHRSHEGWELETRYVAQALANLILTFSPKRVIVGGGLTKKLKWTLLRATIRELLNGYIDAPELNALIGEYIVRPGLGNDSGVVGAIALASMRAVRLHVDENVKPPEGRALSLPDQRDEDRLKTREPIV